MAEPTQDERDKAEIERLRSVHPDYEEKRLEWLFFLKSYEGGCEYAGKDTLFTHVREHSNDYDDRLKRAHFQNYCQPLADFVPDFIYASDIERDAGALKGQFNEFQSNVNRAGLNITEFMREIAEEARIFGHMFVQVDKPPLPADLALAAAANGGRVTISAARAAKLKLNPYFIKVTPLEILDWVTNGDGEYDYLKRKECIDELVGRSRRAIERYTEWYRGEYLVSRLDVTVPDKPVLLESQTAKPNALGKIPFVKVLYKSSKANRDLSMSFLADIASQNRSVFNLTSLIDEFLYRQCFNILAMPSNSQVATKDTVEGVIGNSNVLEFPDSASHVPQYLSPASEPSEFIQKEREAIVAEMYRTASQDIASELFAGSNRSGDASRQAMGRQVPVIARQADALQQAEQQIFALWAEMQNKKWDGKIAYKDDYSVTSMMDLILEFSSIFTSAKILSPTFVREEWKRLVREFDGKLPQDIMEKIIGEISKVSDDDIVELVKGLPDQAAAGLPATANLSQGAAQRGRSDKQRSLRTGDRAHTKEARRDANKQAKGARGQAA